jgi:mono/diheme cytochrome c family protein
MKKLLKWTGVLVVLVLVCGAGAVVYANSAADGKLAFPDTQGPKLVASTDSAVIERGRYLVTSTAHCSQCHSGSAEEPLDRHHPEMINKLPLAGGLEFAMGPLGTRYARNLTPDPETGIGRYTDEQLARVLRTSVLPDGELSILMRYGAAELADEDIVAIISYLRSLEPRKHDVPPGEWKTIGNVMLTYLFPPLAPRAPEGPKYVAYADEPSVERGEYLVEHVMLCVSCHTAVDPKTFELVGEKLAGSFPDPSHGLDDPNMEFVAPNLTSSPSGMTGKLTEDQFVARLHGGRHYVSSIMPWENFATVEEADLRSVYRYIKTLPPVENDLGPSYREKGSFKGAGE